MLPKFTEKLISQAAEKGSDAGRTGEPSSDAYLGRPSTEIIISRGTAIQSLTKTKSRSSERLAMGSRSNAAVGPLSTAWLPPLYAIAALLPQYTETGDVTQIVTAEGQAICSPLRLKSILRKLSLHQAVDIVALRRKVGRATGRSIQQPLPLAAKTLLIPVKVRKPKVAGDNCTGYLNYYSVTNIMVKESDARYTTVELCGSKTVDVLWSVKTVKTYMNNARLASHEMSREAALQPDIQNLERKLLELLCEVLAAKAAH